MATNRRSFVQALAGAGAAMLMPTSDAAVREGRPVVFRVIDEKSGCPIPARVRLTDGKGNEVVPIGHPQTMPENAQEGDVRFQSRRFAYVDGTCEIDPGRLPLKYQVIKGYEYVFAEGELSTDRLKDGVFAVPMSRWRNWTASKFCPSLNRGIFPSS